MLYLRAFCNTTTSPSSISLWPPNQSIIAKLRPESPPVYHIIGVPLATEPRSVELDRTPVRWRRRCPFPLMTCCASTGASASPLRWRPRPPSRPSLTRSSPPAASGSTRYPWRILFCSSLFTFALRSDPLTWSMLLAAPWIAGSDQGGRERVVGGLRRAPCYRHHLPLRPQVGALLSPSSDL